MTRDKRIERIKGRLQNPFFPKEPQVRDDIGFLLSECERLGEGIRKVLSSRIWGHQHWDASGQSGAGCEICQEQFKVRKELYELVEGGEKDEVSKL